MKRPLIEFENVRFGYPGNLVLDDVSFRIEEGSYVGIIGPNGGGKTTALKLMLGLLKPAEGMVRVFGEDVARHEDKADIGYVPQHAAHTSISFPATVKEVVESGRTPRHGLFAGFSAKDRKAVRTALEVAGIWPLKDRLMRELSGGERQRVLVARALASEPRILILDEPFEGVDEDSQRGFYGLLHDLNAKRGLTILFVTHDVEMIGREAHEIICLNRRLECQGSSKEIIHIHTPGHRHGALIKHAHRHDD
jgi:zinc transport system ATP-binding protein